MHSEETPAAQGSGLGILANSYLDSFLGIGERRLRPQRPRQSRAAPPAALSAACLSSIR